MRFSRVLLPEPEGPVIVMNSDGATVSETPRSARIGPNDLTTSCTRTSTPPGAGGRPSFDRLRA